MSFNTFEVYALRVHLHKFAFNQIILAIRS